jgi:hypothetical protein
MKVLQSFLFSKSILHLHIHSNNFRNSGYFSSSPDGVEIFAVKATFYFDPFRFTSFITIPFSFSLINSKFFIIKTIPVLVSAVNTIFTLSLPVRLLYYNAISHFIRNNKFFIIETIRIFIQLIKLLFNQ